MPANAAEMRDLILAAVRSGRIEDLVTAFEWNELKPEISDSPVDDPAAHWKALSVDGEGREILAVIANILALGPARLRQGRDLENSTVYVWPYLAERPLDKLTPAEHVDLLRLMPAGMAAEMIAKQSWTWWRLSIGSDGTWLAFRRPG